MVWKPTFDVIVSDCALKPFLFGTRILKVENEFVANSPISHSGSLRVCRKSNAIRRQKKISYTNNLIILVI